MIPQDIINNLLNAVEELKINVSATECWVVRGGNGNKNIRDAYVFVGDSPCGLNGTQFAVISPMMATRAVTFESREQAEKYGYNHYLLDGNDKPIYMRTQRLSDFAKEMLKEAEELLQMLKDAGHSIE